MMCLLYPVLPLIDGRGPVSVSVWGYDLLRLRWWNSASLQPHRSALCLHAATAAPPWLWRLGHHWGQVRKSSGVTQPFFGIDPLQDQMQSIYSSSCLKCLHFTVQTSLLFLFFDRNISLNFEKYVAFIPWSLQMYSIFSPISHLFSTKTDTRYPDSTAVTYDPVSNWLSCVYSDHSLYVWDVRDVNRAGKVHSALFHAACVWDLEVNTGRRKWTTHL